MCDSKGGFKFCTCTDDFGIGHNELEYSWVLQRLAELKDQRRILGKIVLPTEDLGCGITREEVLKKLNANKCFDFEYHPAEGDTLHVSTPGIEEKSKYFSLIFKNGSWTIGNAAFSPKKTIKMGNIKINKTENNA